MIRRAGDISYTLMYKKVKNINLHVKRDGTVWVSAPPHAVPGEIDAFVLRKTAWIERTRRKVAQRERNLDAEYSDAECLAVFAPVIDSIYPIFAPYLPQKPNIYIKSMRSCWGVCHYNKGYITLSRALAAKPIAAIEYVILHEFVHFIEHDHQAGFHRWMARLMPDYKERRKLLR